MRHNTTLRYIDTIARLGSIRRAAESLAITPSALNRRLLALEEEIGAPLFDRQARGVRLSAAGEIFVDHARRQMADMARVRATIEDMKGARRGHVSLALDPSLPDLGIVDLVAREREQHPSVTFSFVECDRTGAEGALQDYEADLVVALEPVRSASFSTLATLPVRLEVVVRDDHSLASRPSLRLRELAAFPLAMPVEGDSLSFLLTLAAQRTDSSLDPVVSCPADAALRLVRSGAALTFRCAVDGVDGTASEEGTVAVPLAANDAPRAFVHLGQLRDRALPVPSARFAETLRRRLAQLHGEA